MNPKKLAHNLEPLVRIGKNGLTEEQIREIKKQLNKKKIIKIKILRSMAKDKKLIKERILEETGAELISAIGNIIIIYKKV